MPSTHPTAWTPRLFQEALPDFISRVRPVTGFISFLKINYYYYYWGGHVHCVMHVEVGEQPGEAGSLLVPLCGFQGWHSCRQACMARDFTH